MNGNGRSRGACRAIGTLALTCALVVAVSVSDGAAKGTTRAVSTDVATASVGFSDPIQGLDPDIATDPAGLAILHLLGGTLTHLSAFTGVAATPGLAASWATSKDQLMLTLQLKPNLKFSDGTPLTSADVQATLNRAVTDKGNVNAGVISQISSIDAPTPTTVVIHLSAPAPSLTQILAEPGFAISPKAGIAQGADYFKTMPIFAGQYKLDALSTDQIVISANPNYYGSQPAIHQITFLTVSDPNARVAQVESGQLSLAYDVSSDLVKNLSGGARAIFTPFYGFFSFVPQDHDKVMKDVRIRQALNYAVDRKQINKIVWSGNPAVKPLAGFWPTTMPGYQPSIPTAQNIPKAKQWLKGTACANGCTLSLMYNNLHPYNAALAVVLRENFKKIGVNLKLDQVESAVSNKRNSTGAFQMRIGPLYDYLSVPDGMLSYGLKSNGGVFANFSRYNSPKMDALIKKIVSTPLDQQKPLLKQVSDLFEKDRPYITLSDLPIINVTTLSSRDVKVNSTGFIDVR